MANFNVGSIRLGIERRAGAGTRIAQALLLFLALALGACGQAEPMRVTLVADGQRQFLRVTAASAFTVRDLLQTTGLELGPLDRVEPDLYVELVPDMTVVLTRVEETFVTERQILPFAHETMRSEAVPEGERRLLQPGRNGEIEIVYEITLEDGVEVRREEVRRDVLAQPVDETVLVGVQGALAAVPITGTVVYLSGGNAWIMRESSELRRNITGSGDLDGRVFDLSADGSRLLFTRAVPGDDMALNSLWMARTSLVGEEAVDLGVSGVIWAAWAPGGERLAYSTAERSGGVPGWKAHNDLWLLTLPEEGSPGEPEVEPLLPATAEVPYAWWGRSYAWSPDGNSLAYAQADEVGILSVTDKVQRPVATFPSYRTQSQWAWVPTVSWSPDGYLLAFVAHEGDMEGLSPEDSPVFGLWVASADGALALRLAEEVGMWSSPRWTPGNDGERLCYGQAQSPRNSEDSRYELLVMDRDGSNKQHLFPPEGLMGLVAPSPAWSPTGDALLVAYEGNIYRVHLDGRRPEQLTSDGQSTQPRWAQ